MEKLLEESGGILRLTEGYGKKKVWEEKIWSFVLQQCCQDKRIQEFINGELRSLCWHKNYHRVVKKTLECHSHEAKTIMKEEVLAANGEKICCDQYVSRVVEALIDVLNNEEIVEVVNHLEEANILTMCMNEFGSFVVKKLLKIRQLDWFVGMLLSDDDATELVKLAKNRCGSFVVEALFDNGDPIIVDRLSKLLIGEFEDLARTPHGGSHVAARFAGENIETHIYNRAKQILCRHPPVHTWPENICCAFRLEDWRIKPELLQLAFPGRLTWAVPKIHTILSEPRGA